MSTQKDMEAEEAAVEEEQHEIDAGTWGSGWDQEMREEEEPNPYHGTYSEE